MTLADLKLPPIKFIKAAKYTAGRTEKVIAFVNHRMVGYLAGTDAYFQNPDRGVSTHFGIGYGADGVVQIHQYVPLDDTAYGNGNYDPSGSWDNWGYKTNEINAATISIEHQDHGDPAGKGVVSAKVQEASQKLQALLRYGTIAQWKAAGIVVRDWTNNAPILLRELRAIPVDGRHIITHNDIAGRLKPYCWKPWSSDTVGFPRATYVAKVKEFGAKLAAPVVTPPPPPPPVSYTQGQLDAAVAAAVATQKAADQAAIDAAEKTARDALAKVAAERERLATLLETEAQRVRTP